jgi:hypothetical protein
MTQKKKAELQRKLAVAPVAKPPDGLAERIKADIPKYLFDADRERRQLSRSIGLNLRVAASILLLIGGAFLMIAVLSRTESQKAPVASATGAPAAAPMQVADQAKENDAYISPARAEAPPAVEAQTEKKDLRAKPSSAIGAVGGKLTTTAAANEGARRAREDESESRDQVLAVPPPQAPPTVAASAPAVPPPLAAAEPRPESPRQAPALADATSKSRAAVMSEAFAASIAPLDQSQLFGISVDRKAFDRLKGAIEIGARPDPRDVDVEALVNYFAGPAPRTRDVRLDVEVTSAPANSGVCCVLRVTVDTPPSDSPFIGKDAELEIAFDRDVVRDFSRSGGEQSTKLVQPVLPPNASVTALYDFQLKPNPPRRTPIATVTLRYRTLPRDRERTIVETVRLGDIKRSWSTGSRRHRLASLGAMWAETLRDSGRAAEVAVKAEELSKQQPADERARDLAKAAGRTQEKAQEQR